ncbi:DUF2889 domain-containing protein [Novosphingobium album (ex Liu et al. 2023)]|uniref:DUF2889 domain-containing protein n=1 Tax=Novosphingobium album (ex Liu et al. 2023) TaxID=3031130 RepID=A0ABT5WUM2_9SPHN|nr:DUF2889 domain-containing protein [Novosphingobium album (ex Liu et al. 2023)]MDE8653557.1 DUF2889 domain-containing protein [Novosphingobium album (ex Liu et al. 2023)]
MTALADPVAALCARNSAGPAPPRAPGSVRRTSTIDVGWPDGPWGDMAFTARARDIVTPLAGGAPQVCAEDGFEATIDRDRTIVAIRTFPHRAGEARLAGHRGGGHLRRALEEIMPEERREGTPLYLILDDISGASLVSGWAWSQWTNDWLHARDGSFDEAQFARAMAERVGICVGFAPGATVHRLGAGRRPSSGAPTCDLRDPHDPQGWHAYAEQQGVGLRRARRIDVTRGEAIVIDAAFQDSATRPDGGRQALHEYRIMARVTPDTLGITAIEAEPRVLPFPECPGASRTLDRLIGAPLGDLRAIVLERLRGTAGCTHLNDALRALAEVPRLVSLLDQP